MCEAHADEVWAWVQQRYEAVLAAQCPDHLLVRLRHFDFAELERVYGGYHCYAGLRGQPASHTIGQLCRALLVKHLYDCSYRKTTQLVRTDGLVRCFVGYGLQEQTLSHATLQRFAQWVMEQDGGRCFFSEMLRQIDEELPAEADKVQYGDTFAMQSAARPQSRTELLRTACQRLLTALEVALPDQVAALVNQVEQTALFGASDEVRETMLERSERCAREEATALAAAQLLHQVTQALTDQPGPRTVARAGLETWQQRLEKILHDDFLLTTEADGWPSQARLRTQRVKGAYALGSTVDPEATFRIHGGHTCLGYNVSIAATDTFIREIAVATGATPDCVGLPGLLSAQLEHLGLCPPKIVYDAAAGAPKHFADVQTASQGQTQLVARLQSAGRPSARFGPSDFTVGEQGELTCPAGQVSTRAYSASGADGVIYRFSAQQCQGCPLWDQCRGDAVRPDQPRQLFVSHYAYHQREALAYTKTPQFEAEMKQRAHIERIIAGLVRYNGARRATGYGVDRADFQARMAATAYNLKRYVKLMTERDKAARRRTQAPPPSV